MSRAPVKPQDVYEAYRILLTYNMTESFATVANERHEMPVDLAINAALGMMDFGLFMSRQYPSTAATLRLAVEELEKERQTVPGAERAVEAVVEKYEEIVAKIQQPE